MHREYYKTFEFMVRVPLSSNSRATRIVLGTYGNDALISNAMQVRK